MSCCRARTGIFASVPRPSAPSWRLTKWSTRRSTGCSRSAWPTCAATRRNSHAWPGSWSRTRAREQVLLATGRAITRRRSSCSTAFAPPSMAWSVSSAPAPDHHRAVDRAADAARDPAVHARHDVRIDGHAGAVRNRGAGGLFQCHAAGPGLGRGQAQRASWRSSTIRSSAISRCMKPIPATTSSSCGCSAWMIACASCSAPTATPKAGRTTASR